MRFFLFILNVKDIRVASNIDKEVYLLRLKLVLDVFDGLGKFFSVSQRTVLILESRNPQC